MHVADLKHRKSGIARHWIGFFSALIGSECGTRFLSQSQSAEVEDNIQWETAFVTVKKETGFDSEKLHLHHCTLTSPSCFFCHVSVFSGFPTSSAATENTFGATMLLPQKFQNSRMTEPNRPPGDKNKLVSQRPKQGLKNEWVLVAFFYTTW